MMEKYGTDVDNLPISDEQIRRIKELGGADMLKNINTRAQADSLIKFLIEDEKE